MKIKSKTPLVIVLVVVVTYLAAWISGWELAVNSTKSMPRGVYVVRPLGDVQRGQLVALCISNQAAADSYKARGYLVPSGQCGGGLPRLLKPVVGLPGDVVAVTAAGTTVNGELLLNSRVFDSDSDGRPIEHLPIGWTKRLASDEYFVLANYIERSLDSRYYGTVRRADLKGSARPLITI